MLAPHLLQHAQAIFCELRMSLTVPSNFKALVPDCAWSQVLKHDAGSQVPGQPSTGCACISSSALVPQGSKLEQDMLYQMTSSLRSLQSPAQASEGLRAIFAD